MQTDRWQALMAKLGLPPALATFEALLSAYSEPHRYYHRASHVDACLGELDEVRAQVAEPGRAELALWFHDAVYRPTSPSNERDSADWARRFLTDLDADSSLIQAVDDAIMATRHTAVPENELSKWVVDIDLSILGYPPREYAQFEENIKREYSRIPGLLFRLKRAEILESLLSRGCIYSTEWFRRKYECCARQNLREAVAKLRG